MAIMPNTDPKSFLRRRLAFALDYPDLQSAREGAEKVAQHVGILKVGLELFVANGPPAVQIGKDLGCAVFLDLKLHDIPETVERAVATACGLGVNFLTIHAGGGPKMMEKAAARAAKEGTGLMLLAVTVLTSLDAADLIVMGVSAAPNVQALRLAMLAQKAGVQGIVCSAAEVAVVRRELGSKATIVTPGIRPAGADVGDQKRVATPTSAVRDGADILVVGRPIRDAADMSAAASGILKEIAEA